MPSWGWAIIASVVGIGLAALVLWLGFRKKKQPEPAPKNVEETTDKVLADKDKAVFDYQKKLKDISKETEVKIKKASEEQAEKFEEMKDKPAEDVAAWLDEID